MSEISGDPGVRAYYAAAADGQARLMAQLRDLILETAGRHADVAPLSETLKWGEPSYTPLRPRVGSSVRLQKRADGSVALMFICHTGLVGRFRETYPDLFAYEGDRAIVLDPAGDLRKAELAHCIAMALTYHRN